MLPIAALASIGLQTFRTRARFLFSRSARPELPTRFALLVSVFGRSLPHSNGSKLLDATRWSYRFLLNR